MNSDRLGMVFGSQYYRYPFPRQKDWARDMENMKRLGFNTVKLWAVWNEIEPICGQYRFEALDQLMDLAWQNGLRVVVNIIPEGAPYWLYKGNEDSLYQTENGERVTPGGPANLPSAGWPGLCMDKPEAATAITGFIRSVSRHIASHPALLVIDVWNEPHLEPMFDYRDRILCYCPHSIAQFRSWLIKKYQTIENLNTAWYRTYTSWEQVTPPPRLGTWTDMMDWRLFWLYNLQRWMELRVNAAKEGAPETLIQSHVAYSGYVGTQGGGGLANELGDEFLLAEKTDVFGLTCFPKWLMREDPWFNHFINNEIVAAAAGKHPFYQVELQGGGGKAGLLGGAVPSADDVRYWNYASIAAGGKGVTYWQYAPEPAGIESPGFGLTGLQGENTERSLAAKRCAEELGIPLFARSRRVCPQNAIYLSRVNSVWFYGAGREERLYAQAIHGAYATAYQNGIPITFAHQDHVEHLYENGIRTLLVPMPITLSAREISAMEHFVALGGTLVSEAFPGLYDESGELDTAGTALNRLFGLNHLEVDQRPDSALSCDAFEGTLYRQLIRPDPSTTVLSRFADGFPAMTERTIGRGTAVWMASFAFLKNAETYSSTLEKSLLSYLVPYGYSVWKHLETQKGYAPKPRRAPTVRLLETDEDWILMLLNPLEQEASILIEPACPWEGQKTLCFKLKPQEYIWRSYAKG